MGIKRHRLSDRHTDFLETETETMQTETAMERDGESVVIVIVIEMREDKSAAPALRGNRRSTLNLD